jgi:hypothetical protein
MIALKKVAWDFPEANITNFDESNWRLVMASEQIVWEREAEVAHNYTNGKANFNFFPSICANGTKFPVI